MIDIPELKWVRVHVNFHDKLRAETVAQAKLMIQSYLRGNYPDHSVLTFAQLPMIEGDKEADKPIAKKTDENREPAELKPKVIEPTFEEKLWGYAKWASLGLLLIIALQNSVLN